MPLFCCAYIRALYWDLYRAFPKKHNGLSTLQHTSTKASGKCKVSNYTSLFFSMPGVDVRTWTSKDSSSWAVLVVTAIMSRTQALSTAKEMVFLDSTASCDETQSTVTVVLTATPVGAMPLAVLLHSSQSTESYKAAFDLLKQSYPLCFGGAPVSMLEQCTSRNF